MDRWGLLDLSTCVCGAQGGRRRILSEGLVWVSFGGSQSTCGRKQEGVCAGIGGMQMGGRWDWRLNEVCLGDGVVVVVVVGVGVARRWQLDLVLQPSRCSGMSRHTERAKTVSSVFVQRAKVAPHSLSHSPLRKRMRRQLISLFLELRVHVLGSAYVPEVCLHVDLLTGNMLFLEEKPRL